jgi:hypothetical protein
MAHEIMKKIKIIKLGFLYRKRAKQTPPKAAMKLAELVPRKSVPRLRRPKKRNFFFRKLSQFKYSPKQYVKRIADEAG